MSQHQPGNSSARRHGNSAPTNHPSPHAHQHGHVPRASHIHQGHMQPDMDSASLSSSRFDIDWEAKERELEEARARAAQMEKTMRWWSDCTANWREKWSKVRSERNKSREEAKILRTKLELALKDCSISKREKQNLEAENELLRREIERLQKDSPQPGNYHQLNSMHNVESHLNLSFSSSKSELNMAHSPRVTSPVVKESNQEEDDCTKGVIPKYKSPRSSSVMTDRSSLLDNEKDGLEKDTRDKYDEKVDCASPLKFLEALEAQDVEYLQQKLSHLQLRLDEASKTIQAERDEKCGLHRTLESLQLELLELRSKHEDLRLARQELEREVLCLQESHRQQLHNLQQDCKDEAHTRENLDRRLADLRAELERLQAENAAEWGKRERLETERQALERDNKKLRAALADMQERLEKRSKGATVTLTDGEIKQLQADMEERNKELSELRHAHTKLKKVLQEKSVELGHSLRRAEQSEVEVKRLRSRIDELKRDLAAAEDEVDTASNSIRKLQRTNEELQEQVESLSVQVEHLQTRLRSSSSFLNRDALLHVGSDDEAPEF